MLISKGPLVFVLSNLLPLPMVSLPHFCLEDVEIPSYGMILVIYSLPIARFLSFSVILFLFENVMDMHQVEAFTQGIAASYHLDVPSTHDSLWYLF